MAKKVKISRKEIKQDDEFITFMRNVFDTLALYSREIFIGIGIAAAGVLLYFGVNFYLSIVEKKAQTELSKAQSILTAPVVPAEQLKAQPAIKKMYPNVVTSEKEKNDRAIEKFEEIASKFSRARQGILARYYKAIILARQGRCGDALPAYDEYLAKITSADPLWPLAMNGKGVCLESQGKLDEAADVYQKAAAYDKNVADQRVSYLNLARVQESKKDYKSAAESLGVYLKLAGESPDKAEIERQIDALKRMAGS